MICAITDYLFYKCKRGKYSHNNLLKQGAQPGVIPKGHVLDVKTGDMFFLHTRNSFLSWCVMYYTNSIWSHCGIIGENNLSFDSTTSGVIKHPFTDYLDENHYVAVGRIPGISKEIRDKINPFLNSWVGAPYGWGHILRMFIIRISGRHDKYYYKFYIDILFLFSPLFIIGLINIVFIKIYLFVISFYLAIVLYNRLIIKKKRLTRA